MATALASVLELVVWAVPADMICVPFTVMPLTKVFWLPENEIVEVEVPTSVGTGAKPAALAGPTIVTTLPDAVAV